jgi:hypothetical protein
LYIKLQREEAKKNGNEKDYDQENYSEKDHDEKDHDEKDCSEKACRPKGGARARKVQDLSVHQEREQK